MGNALRRLELVLVGAVYVLLFLALSHPMGWQFPRAITTDGPHPVYAGDAAMFVWNVDHFASAVRHGTSLFYADDLVLPVGADLRAHTYTPILGALGLLLRSPIGALALGIAASFVLSGLGGYLFARRFLERRALAVIAGAVFAFCPYKLARLLGHFNLELTTTIPFFALVVLDWHLEHPVAATGVAPMPRPRVWLAASLLLLVTLASDFYCTYFCLWIALSTVLLRLVERYPLRASRRKVIAVLALTLGASTALVETYFALGGQAGGAFGYSADLVGYLLPSSSHFLVGGPRLAALNTRLRNGTIEHEVYAGVTIVALVGALFLSRALKLREPRERWLAWLGATFLLLASPVIRVGGIRLLGLPHAVLNMLPFIGNLRVPARFSVVTMLVAGVLAMVALERVVLPRLARSVRVLAVAATALLLFLEYRRAPFSTLTAADVPPIYADLAARPAGALLEIPFGLRDGHKSVGAERTSAMWFATVHHKPLLGGMVARLPAATFARYEQHPLLGPLLAAQGDKPTPLVPAAIPRARVDAFIEEVNLRYVLLRPEARGTVLAAAVGALFNDRIAETRVDGEWTLWVLRR